jgi:uncharacterized membrane protein
MLMLVSARNFPMSLVVAPVRSAIAPRISREQRATYLSLQGLAERLFFALLLLGLASGIEQGVPVDASTLLSILTSALWLGIAAALLIFLLSTRIRQVLKIGEPGK